MPKLNKKQSVDRVFSQISGLLRHDFMNYFLALKNRNIIPESVGHDKLILGGVARIYSNNRLAIAYCLKKIEGYSDSEIGKVIQVDRTSVCLGHKAFEKLMVKRPEYQKFYSDMVFEKDMEFNSWKNTESSQHQGVAADVGNEKSSLIEQIEGTKKHIPSIKAALRMVDLGFTDEQLFRVIITVAIYTEKKENFSLKDAAFIKSQKLTNPNNPEQ